MLNTYKPYVLILLLLINSGWIYALTGYSNLILPKVIMISAPLLIGTVIYCIGYIKFMNMENGTEN